jgi:hypothetical protein
MTRLASILLGLTLAPSALAASERDWPRFLATRDLLVEARVLAMVDSVRTGSSPAPRRELTLAVSRVLAGVAPDTTIAIRVPRANDHLSVGEVILAWGYHDDDDLNRLHGGILQYKNDAKRRASIARVDRLRKLSPSRVFDRVSSACLVRVVGSRRTDGAYPVFLVEGLEWVIGPRHRFPREVVFRIPETNNCAFVATGDTLLVPLGKAGRESVTIPFCPNFCVIHDGHLAAINVTPEEFLHRAFERDGSEFVLRKVLVGR